MAECPTAPTFELVAELTQALEFYATAAESEGYLNQAETLQGATVVMTKLLTERDKTRQILADAPHDGPRDGDDGYGCQVGLVGGAKCTCWKAGL